MTGMSVDAYLSGQAPFEFYNVRHLILGVNAASKVADEVVRLAGEKARVFLVTDRGVQKQGLTDKLQADLHRRGFGIQTYDNVPGEPTFDSLRNATAAVRERDFDVVVGIGGGSVMDTAKTVAIMKANSGDVSSHFGGLEDRIKEKPLPKILLPTTAGTGSEVTCYAVAVNEESVKTFITSSHALADAAIVDPLLSMTCPPRITACAGMDALAQAIECILTPCYTAISDALSLHAIELISRSLRSAYYEGDDLEARYNMAMAATLAGISINIVPNNIGHCVSEAIGPMYKIPHGVANAIVTPYQMQFNLPATVNRMATIATRLQENVHEMSKREAAKKAIRAVRALVEDLELPTSLRQMNVPREDLPRIVDHLVKERQILYDLPKWNPRKLTTENVTELLERMWEGAALECD